MKELRDLNDLTIHDVQPISDCERNDHLERSARVMGVWVERVDRDDRVWELGGWMLITLSFR